MRKRRNILTVLTALIIVSIFILYMITYVVREGEVAVLTTFKKVARVVEQPGLYWKAPPPIQTVVKFDARLHTDKDRFEETKTSEGELLVLLAYYTWRVDDPELFYTKFYTRDEAETLKAARRRLGDVVRDAKNDVFGQYAFSDLMPWLGPRGISSPEAAPVEAGAGSKPKFGEIEAAILNKVAGKARDEYGIEVSQVGIMRLELPPATTTVVFKRMQAERKRYASDILARGQGEADGIRSMADEAAKSITAIALARAEEELAEGDKAAAKYYDAFAQNPDLHDFLLRLKALRTIVDEGTTIIMSADSEVFKLLGGPPPELLKETGTPDEQDE